MVNGHIFFLQFESISINVPFSLEFQLFISYLVIEIKIPICKYENNLEKLPEMDEN